MRKNEGWCVLTALVYPTPSATLPQHEKALADAESCIATAPPAFVKVNANTLTLTLTPAFVKVNANTLTPIPTLTLTLTLTTAFVKVNANTLTLTHLRHRHRPLTPH